MSETVINIDEIMVQPPPSPPPSAMTPTQDPVPVPESKPEIVVDATTAILEQVAKELKSFLAGNKITLANLTGVVIDLYNFIQSFKSLTTNQKSMMMVTVLREFVRSEMDNDPIMLAVVETLVPRVMETLVGVSTGNINIGEVVEDMVEDVVEDVHEKASGCLSCFSKLFKK